MKDLLLFILSLQLFNYLLFLFLWIKYGNITFIPSIIITLITNIFLIYKFQSNKLSFNITKFLILPCLLTMIFFIQIITTFVLCHNGVMSFFIPILSILSLLVSIKAVSSF